ncbi:hypothetical protein F0562_019632 [Nyssa sinensis]|uniref:Uncharacterized protein n=1 Tax=Nyssa sinensis TaxID=561372 RepID=A0A5J5BPS8_9ASTE|nr:hypothetical protein F0562_019632 [Nyssa sinensis]
MRARTGSDWIKNSSCFRFCKLNDLVKAGVPTFGLSSEVATLEGSKNFMKNLCDKYRIPTTKGFFILFLTNGTLSPTLRRIRIFLTLSSLSDFVASTPRCGCHCCCVRIGSNNKQTRPEDMPPQSSGLLLQKKV